MGMTFSLVCHETKQKLWIGQGGPNMTTFYSGEPKIMGLLEAFLQETYGKPLVLMCNDRDGDFFIENGYKEFLPDGTLSLRDAQVALDTIWKRDKCLPPELCSQLVQIRDTP